MALQELPPIVTDNFVANRQLPDEPLKILIAPTPEDITNFDKLFDPTSIVVGENEVEFDYLGDTCVLLLDTGFLYIKDNKSEHRLFFPVSSGVVLILRELAGWGDPSGKSWMIKAERGVVSNSPRPVDRETDEHSK